MSPPPTPLRFFSQIFIERSALPYPDTTLLLEKFPRAHHTIIDSYKEILNRPHQDWRLQKKSPKLILAKREPPFLYPISSMVQSSATTPNAFYTAPALNCLYDCAYCYLQGMFASPHLVVFVNSEDYFDAVRTAITAHGQIWLALTYDTDLLAFESILPLTKRWIDFARSQPGLNLEIRTKSVNIDSLEAIPPCPNVLLAWTLSPPEVAARYEAIAPNPEARLSAAIRLIERGWKVRFCFDPIVADSGWAALYQNYFSAVQQRLTTARPFDITAGTFRMPDRYFRKLKQIRSDSLIAAAEYEHEHEEVAYATALRAEIRTKLTPSLAGFGVPVYWW